MYLRAATITLSLVSTLLAPSWAVAQTGTVTTIATKGRLLLEENFTSPGTYTTEYQPIAKGWRVSAWHGEWKRSGEDGVESRWVTGHMPVLAYEGSFGDVIIELEFRYQKEPDKLTKKAVCRISATNPELDPRAYSVSAWANQDSKERPLGMVLEHDQWKPGTITTVENRPATFEPGKWHTMRLEVVGNRALAVAGGVVVSGTHEKFGLPKTLIVLGTGLCPHQLRRLRVYEAKPAPQAYVPLDTLRPTVPLVALLLDRFGRMIPAF